MILLALGLLAGPASAGSLVVSVGPETPIDMDRSGNWGRLFPAVGEGAGGWDFFFAAGGEYLHVPLDAAFVPDLSRTTRLTGRSDLVDHAITRCPDGTWLHIASTTAVRLDDSAWAFRYDADLHETASAQLFDAEPTQVHRDMPVVCAEGFSATGFFDPDNLVSFRLVELASDASVVRTVEPLHAPIVTGSSLIDLDGTVAIASFPGNEDDYLHVTEYALPDLSVVDRHLQNLSVTGEKAYWSQGFARVGNRYVLAYMARDESAGFAAQDGNLWLGIFNLDWRLQERIPLSDNAPPDGGMQPWIAFDGDTLAVCYTRGLQTYVFPVTIDRVEAGLDPAPEGAAAREAAPDTSGDTSDEREEETAGCRGAHALALLPFLLLGRRRRA